MAKVIVYTQHGCGPCHQEVAWLTQNNVDFEERNISENPEYIDDLRKVGAMATPVTFVGDEVIFGFDRNKLQTLLAL